MTTTMSLMSMLTCAALLKTPPKVIEVKQKAGRFIRVVSRINDDDGAYPETDIYDRNSPRFSSKQNEAQFAADDGFDGKRYWAVDGTGKPFTIRKNEEADAFLYNWLTFGSPLPASLHPRWHLVNDLGAICRFSVTTERLAAVNIETDRGRIVRMIDPNVDAVDTRFSGYRDDKIASYPIFQTNAYRGEMNRSTQAAIDLLDSIPKRAFQPPPLPHETILSGRTTVKFKDIFGLPVFHGTINGAKEAFEMDTGASMTLNVRSTRDLRLASFRESLVGGFGNGIWHQRSTMLQRLQIGGMQMFDVPTDVIGHDFLVADAVVGCELLQRFVVTLDYGKHEFSLSRAIPSREAAAKSVPLEIVDCTPKVRASVDGISGYFNLDTGAAVAIDINTPTVRRYGLLARYRAKHAELTGRGIGGDTYGALGVARRVTVGDITKVDVPLELSTMKAGTAAETTETGTIGDDFFQGLRLVFDYKHRRVWIERSKTK